MNNTTYLCPLPPPGVPPRFYTTGFMLLPVTFSGLLGSGVCAYTLRRNRQPSLSLSMDILFDGMSLLSFLLSAGVLPFHIYTTLTGPRNILATPAYQPLCKAIGFLLLVTTQAAVTYHAVIALHRLFIVVLAPRRPVLKSRAVLVALAVAPWAEAVLFNLWPLAHIGAELGYNCMTDRCMLAATHSPGYHVFVRMATPALAFPLMLVSYAAICCRVFRVRARFIRTATSTVVPEGGAAAPRRKKTLWRLKNAWLEMKLTKVAFVACVTFSACYLPVTVRTLFIQRYEEMYSQLSNAMGILNWLGCTLSPWMTVYLHRITHGKGNSASKASQVTAHSNRPPSGSAAANSSAGETESKSAPAS
ncbi:uncharacterized protein LOC129588003 isoform X2 [Paramacrobiotus metropolitanus]|uniref:uncharacterized protein LOC129588003 isoform X2 n=1 Tax=Paramacrobiotus metropolitanus TaxID=2943436 RepID=UPI0024461F38|nr:uncharacterized protein LOC129588003 isoform X2 [Paramacrobiotus metropolitanus]